MKKRDKKERGSAAIEAVVSLTIFIVAIITILSFINICRAQAAVSAAVDATAKEMAQYAYFYHLTGLDALEQIEAGKVAGDRQKMNDIVGGTEAVYSIFTSLGSGGDVGQLVEDSVKAASGVDMGDSDVGKVSDMIHTLGSIENPMDFMKSVATVGALELGSFAKSQLIAAPLARILVKKHFQVNEMDADTYLRTLRIDGMDALNFSMSTIFTPTAPNDIHLVCYYQMKPVQFFNFEFGTITLCKESVTRAWLGGDRVYEAKKNQEDSIWNMPSLERGKYIVNAEKEKIIKQNGYEAAVTGVDAFQPQSNTWYHIRSLDTYSATYLNDANAVKNTLYKEYANISGAADTSKETIYVRENGEKKELSSPKDTRRTHMIIVIPEDVEPEAFEEGMRLFRESMADDESFTYEVVQGYGKSGSNPSNQGNKEEATGGDDK